MAKTRNDMYANMASASITLVDNSLEFTELVTGISLGQGTGILIDKIEYSLLTAEGALDDGKNIQIGWCTSNAVTAMNLNDRRVLHRMLKERTDYGTAGNARISKDPDHFEFTPPIIVAAPRLYLAATASASSGANSLVLFSRFYFRYIDLTDKEYLEIAETFILVG